MVPHSFIARAEAQRWVGIAEKLLNGHDLVGSKTFAIRARESDPRLESADQILAIIDTLLAAEKRVVGNNGAQQPDFYAILQVVRFVQDTEHIADQYRRLAVTLNPNQNRFPYSDQAFQLVNDAWAVLSNPVRKSWYDSKLDFPQQQEMNQLGFNLEQNHHHQQEQHQHQHQQQHQHNFFSINPQKLAEQQQTIQARVQQSHQQQHNFLSPIREQEQLFQQREREELFQPQVVQPLIASTTPEQQSRPPPQPPMRSATPPPPRVAPAQPPVSWPQPPPHSQPQAPMTPIAPPPPAAPPQPQPPMRSTTPPPRAPVQPPVSWPQAPPNSEPQPLNPQPQSQPEQEQEEHHQQHESPEQNAAPVQPPTHSDTNNSVSEEEKERVTESDSENVDASPTFWTACPYCLYMYEYPRLYSECTLRCSNCERAFQAVPIPSPPPIIEDQEAYFCCWGSFPLGLAISHFDNNHNDKATNKNWAHISPLYDVSTQFHYHLSNSTPKKSRNWGPRVYIDDFTDDIFTDIPEPSDDSDLDWNGTKNNKVKKMKKRGRKRKAKDLKKTNKNMQNSVVSLEEDVGLPTVPLVSNPRRQSGRVAKELGKLDLNVEFNNNEGEESTPRMAAANREGEEDNIEGNGFFEGLDEFLSSLPILSVVNEEKVKDG